MCQNHKLKWHPHCRIIFLGPALFFSIKISTQHIPLKDNKKHMFFVNIKYYAKGLDVPKNRSYMTNNFQLSSTLREWQIHVENLTSLSKAIKGFNSCLRNITPLLMRYTKMAPKFVTRHILERQQSAYWLYLYKEKR